MRYNETVFIVANAFNQQEAV